MKTLILFVMIAVSALLKLYVALTMSDQLFVGSDDLGYIKSAKLLLETGILSFHQKGVPTVWITPAYPIFLVPLFALLPEHAALTGVRIAQILISSLTIWITYRVGKRIKNETTGLIAAAIVAFYPASLLTANLILTETLFTFLMMLLLDLALKPDKNQKTFVVLGIVWAVTSLVRPTIAMIPALFFLYYWGTRQLTLRQVLKFGSVMLVAGLLIFSPWWVRNYVEFHKFIPFTYADGAPLLEGSFPGGNVDRSIFIETNPDKIYVNEYYKKLAMERIRTGFQTDFSTYLKWYAVDKPRRLLFDTFYWIQVFKIHHDYVKVYHNAVNVLAALGILIAIWKRKREMLFLLRPIFYFTILYSIYFAFDRYGYPQFTLVSIMAAYGVAELTRTKDL